MVIPPRPAAFHPEQPPPGYELKLISFWRDRDRITPRLQLVHTNWASREGSIEASWNWANAGGGNTIPHLQVDRDGRGAMLLPLDRKGIANFRAADFSIGIETADRGTLTDPAPVGSWFTPEQAETLAVGLAYVAWGYSIPIAYPDRWDGSGTACHTEPFGYPYWTNSAAKRCPGDRKKAQMRDLVMPRASQILAAWVGGDGPTDDGSTEEDEVTDADIQRIAEMVWRWPVVNQVTGESSTAGWVLSGAHFEARSASQLWDAELPNQTTDPDSVAAAKWLVSGTHLTVTDLSERLAAIEARLAELGGDVA